MKSYTITTTQHLRGILDTAVARFNFTKKDGSIRNALGTRSIELIPRPEAEVIGRIEDRSDKAIVFWDLEKGEFRSLSEGAAVAVHIL